VLEVKPEPEIFTVAPTKPEAGLAVIDCLILKLIFPELADWVTEPPALMTGCRKMKPGL